MREYSYLSGDPRETEQRRSANERLLADLRATLGAQNSRKILFAELRGIASARGYSPMWPGKMYRDITGRRAPRWWWDLPEASPKETTLNVVAAMQAAYAASTQPR
jgi:hypothetical protein